MKVSINWDECEDIDFLSTLGFRPWMKYEATLYKEGYYKIFDYIFKKDELIFEED